MEITSCRSKVIEVVISTFDTLPSPARSSHASALPAASSSFSRQASGKRQGLKGLLLCYRLLCWDGHEVAAIWMEYLRHSTILFFKTFHSELAVYGTALWKASHSLVGRVPGGKRDLSTINEK